MTPDERRALEKLEWEAKTRALAHGLGSEAARWEGAAEAYRNVLDRLTGADDVATTVDRIRRGDVTMTEALDRLTDEQSGERKCQTCGGDWSRCNHTWTGRLPELEAPTTEPEDRTENMRLIGVLSERLRDLRDAGGDPDEVAVAIDALIQQRIRLHRSPDSNEPEDDVVERVAQWLDRYDSQRGIRIGTYTDRARRLLHDTGILTRESEV